MKLNSTMLKVGLSGAVLLGVGLAGSTTTHADEIVKGEDTFYKVESGDTLNKIAEAYGTTAEVIQANNSGNILDINHIVTGQEFIVDGKAFDKDAQHVAPVQTEVVQEAVVYEEPVYQEQVQAQEVYQEPVAQVDYGTPQGGSAKEEIARRESTNNYNAMNGQYVGKYQLTNTYLNGDYSPANQERVADQYVADRYGSWENALAFHNQNGWY